MAMSEESGADRTSPLLSLRGRGVLSRAALDSEHISDRALIVANALQQEALTLVEQRGADMTAPEAQRVLRLLLLRRLLLEGADVKELVNAGKDIGSIFPSTPTAEDGVNIGI